MSFISVLQEHYRPVLLFLSVIFLFILYPDRWIGTRSCKHLPGPRGLPLIGNIVLVAKHRKAMIQFMQNMHGIYGDVFTFTAPAWGRTIVIRRPEWLQHIKKQDTRAYSRGDLVVKIFQEFPGKFTPVATEGRDWRLTRSIMRPIFTVKAFTDHVSGAMAEIIPITEELLNNVAAKKMIVDWNDIAGRIALNIFLYSALNLRTDILRPDVSCLKETTTIMDAVVTLNEISAQRLFNPLWKYTEKITGTERRFREARSQLRLIISDIVEERKLSMKEGSSNANGPMDFLSALLSEKSVEGSSDSDLLDILVTLVFGGRDNTQNSLAWSLHELNKAPEWLMKMRWEAEKNDSTGQVIHYEDVKKYPIHLAVFYETVRVWPGLPKNARCALSDDVLPALPEANIPELEIKKGDFILWSDRLMMREPSIWGADAHKFNPARHLDTNGDFVMPTQPNFIGFGEGPRRCPARELVAYQFVSVWSKLLATHDITPVSPKGAPEVETLTTAMGEPFYVTVQRRQSTRV